MASVAGRGDPPHYGRRRLLAAGAVAAVGAALGYGVDALAGGSGPPAPARARRPPHGLVSGRFHSVRRRREVGWTVSYPAGWLPGDGVPLCLVLHGFGDDHRSAFDALALQDPQAALARARPARPLVLAAADGGDGYWHRRADGDDPQGMLMEEFLPLLALSGVVTDHLVAFGWSMGGYGSLLLAETYPGRIRRVGAESPAIWPSFAASQDANPGAFDSAADWRAHDVVGHCAALAGTPVRVDCGIADSFAPAARQLASLLPRGDVVLSPGAHTDAFWRTWAPAQLSFLSG